MALIEGSVFNMKYQITVCQKDVEMSMYDRKVRPFFQDIKVCLTINIKTHTI